MYLNIVGDGGVLRIGHETASLGETSLRVAGQDNVDEIGCRRGEEGSFGGVTFDAPVSGIGALLWPQPPNLLLLPLLPCARKPSSVFVHSDQQFLHHRQHLESD